MMDIMKLFNTNENVVIAIDTSKYTKLPLTPSIKTVFHKVIEYTKRLIESNRKNNNFLYTFDTDCTYHGCCSTIELPHLEPSIGLSYSHKVYDEITKHHSLNTIDKLVIITQNETDSELSGLIGNFILLKLQQPILRLEIVNVSKHEERNCRLSTIMGSYVDSYVSYNSYSMNVDFFGKTIQGDVRVFIEEILKTLDNVENLFEWTHDMITKTLDELGKLLSVLFIMYPTNDSLIASIKKTFERFNCVDGDVILTKRFDKAIYRVKDIKDYRSSSCYETDTINAIDNLKKYGTVDSLASSISLPMSDSGGMICTCNDPSIIKHNFYLYPNSCDEYGNVFFGIGEYPYRNGITEFLNKPMFYIANLLSICMITYGVDVNDIVVKNLRYLALCQASESTLIAKDKYDKQSCFDHWKRGRLIPMSYDNDKTHTSLFSDDSVNHFKLPESLWWALMMNMLGIFDEQLVNYSTALEAYGIEPNEQALITYVRNKVVTNNNKTSYTFSTWDDELVFLAIRSRSDDLENKVHQKFPNHHFKHMDVDLCIDFYYSYTLYIIRGPHIQNELVLKELCGYKDTDIEVLSRLNTSKDKLYGLFDVNRFWHVEDLLKKKVVCVLELADIAKGCLSCGDKDDLILVVVSSNDEMVDITNELTNINKENTLLYVYE